MEAVILLRPHELSRRVLEPGCGAGRITDDLTGLHLYATRDEQAGQLAVCGFELSECLDLEGSSVGPGESAERFPGLHYVARRAA